MGSTEKKAPSKGKKEERKTRRNGRPISLYCTDSEREAIDGNVAKSGLKSRNEFMIRVATGIQITSAIDRQSIEDMIKINANNGRLGGLLKLWLSDHTKTENINTAEIRGVLKLIAKNQNDLSKIIQKLCFSVHGK